jgi:hypothetical protein
MPLDTAVICVYPPPIAVARPLPLIVATLGLLTDHATEPETFDDVGMPDPTWLEPVAVNCAVCPIAVNTTIPAAGVIVSDCNELHPASVKASGKASRAGKTDAKRRRVMENLLPQSYLPAPPETMTLSCQPTNTSSVIR